MCGACEGEQMSKRNGDKAGFNRKQQRPARREAGAFNSLRKERTFETFDSEPAAVSSFATWTERIEDLAH